MDTVGQQARKTVAEQMIRSNKNRMQEIFSRKETQKTDRADTLLDRLRKASDFAGQVVGQALNDGAEIVFSRELGNVDGFYTQKEQGFSKKIVLNAQMSDERLMSSLVRLARYAGQKVVLDPQMTMHAAVTIARAKTADAKAAEAVAAYEMRFSEPDAYQAFFESNMLLAGCCYYAMQGTKNVSRALCNVAKTWYDRPVQKMEGFDNNVINAMCAKGMGNKAAFKNNVSLETLRGIFLHAGQSYMETDFLSGVKANGISENMAAKIERIEKYHHQAFDGKNSENITTSAGRFNVICANGTVRPTQKRLSVSGQFSRSAGRS